MSGLLLHVLPVPWARPKSAAESTFRSRKGSTVSYQSSSVASSRSGASLLHPLYKLVRDTNDIVRTLRDESVDEEKEQARRKEEEIQILSLRMTGATKLEQWEDAARRLDVLEGNNAWKLDSSSAYYNSELITERLEELDRARTSCDIPTMMHLVRTALSRDIGGIGSIDLYRHSHLGTKVLIERYVDATVRTVDALVEQSAIPGALPDGVEHHDVLDIVLYARQSYGRSALLLSGGATFGMSHIGVIKAMYEADVLPRIVSGASAGSIVVSVLCTRTDEEIPGVLKAFPHGALDVFEEKGKELGFWGHLEQVFTHGSWADIKHLTRVMRGVLGDMTFQEAYNRTRRICNICVSSASLYELPRLLNYVTAPNVMIWSAVAASCSVPLVFGAAPILTKDPTTGEHIPWNPRGQGYIDGSVDNDLPMTRLAEMFNVTHFIISQVNPHIVPFLDRDDRLPVAADLTGQPTAPAAGSDWFSALSTLAKDEALHRLHFLTELGIFPNLFTKLQSMLSQKYSGHINILPQIDFHDLPRILKNPDSSFMLRACLSGERATWPKLSRIRYRCATELALDKAVHALKARVVFSKSQVDLRRLATGPVVPRFSRLWSRTSQEGRSTEQDDGDCSDEGSEHIRQRRKSSSNLQIPQYHRKMMERLEVTITDVDTEEEERLELSLRRGENCLHLGARGNVNKVRPKRATRNHLDLSFNPGPLTAPLPASLKDHGGHDEHGFDFARPFSPKVEDFGPSSSITSTLANLDSDQIAGQEARAIASHDEVWKTGALPINAARKDPLDSGRRLDAAVAVDIMSPTEDTSNPDPFTWDADVESHTEDSVSEMESPDRAIPLRPTKA
jgi:TAG lipase / steryl ester hydrolase / phospholipase A2 / LPA acyltransferase